MVRTSEIDKRNLGAKVAELSLNNTYSQVASLIKQEIPESTITERQVQRYVEKVRCERRDQTRAVINEKIKESIPNDLDMLDEVIDSLKDRFESSETERGSAALAGALLRAIDMKLNYSGAGKEAEVTVSVDGWRDEIRSRIARISSRDGETKNP